MKVVVCWFNNYKIGFGAGIPVLPPPSGHLNRNSAILQSVHSHSTWYLMFRFCVSIHFALLNNLLLPAAAPQNHHLKCRSCGICPQWLGTPPLLAHPIAFYRPCSSLWCQKRGESIVVVFCFTANIDKVVDFKMTIFLRKI